MIRNNIYKIPLTLLLLFLLGATNAWGQTEISSLSDITDANGSYTLASNFSTTGTPANGIGSSGNPFQGTIDGGLVTITGTWNKPLFDYVEDATIKNVIIQEVSVSTSANAGAIAANAAGATRIYNCGILGGTVSGSDNVGGLVGSLSGNARVINCYSYADITGGTTVGGIVGNNNVSTTASSIKTMVMNCMFYGDIISGSTISPVYGGNNINNLQGGLNTFNYYAYDKLKTKEITEGNYNCALAVEEKYLTRFEFYRQLLNSNKKLASFYATGSADNANQMAKWVLETADRTIDNPKPYPILKAQGYYPSIINPDIEHAPDSASVGRNKGGKLGKTLSVTISNTKTDGGQSWPTGASITKGSLTLQRTDKDAERYNFNYDKVQLPYYNDVGEGNYTGNRVVTGWKITAITAIDGDPYTASNYPTTGITDYPNHNYANRKSSNKDLYTVSKRVFSQGAYFDVPYGVTSITIEPYWGKACYIADQYYDVVYKKDYSGKQNVTQTGTQVTVGTTKFDGQRIETTVANAINYIKNSLGGLGTSVYDNAVVLVGNLHLDGVPSGGTDPFTMMSVDSDNDHEPDYSLIYHHKNRTAIAPIRFDFLNIPGTAQAQKPNTADLICNFTIFKTRGWFETTNTSLFYSSQLEYENLNGITKVNAPLILHGGVIDQFVSTQRDDVNGNTIYIHIGGNLWMHEFSMGTHSDGSKSTPHVPVSVTGGDYESFYLTGTYNPGAAVRDDNAECHISGGRFGEVAGAGQEQIGDNTTSNGNVHWQIYNADITNFFGGGINDAKPVKGNITTDIFNSYVDVFCGGPKFGNMATGKTVTTTAEGCTFRKYFGGGYGGNSYSRKKYFDYTSYNWSTLQGYYTTDRGKYFNGSSTKSKSGGANDGDYGYKGPGVATDFDYEFFVWSSGSTGARLFVHFVSFSLAQCNDVSSTLKGCTITENFYGGGNLGKVTGTATSVLENCKVTGSVYGGGYSATLPTIPVRDGGFTKAPNFNKSSGIFEPGVYTGTIDYTWKQVASFPSEGGAGFDGTQVITTQHLSNDNLGSVKSSSLTIKGTTVVEGSVYGGGEESGVGGNTEVTVTGGTIGVPDKGGYRYGNVYGGGKGKIDGNGNLALTSVDDLDAGLVKGNTIVTISQESAEKPTTIYHNVYGGGAVGSVGTFTRDANGMPTTCTDGTGNTTVTIKGGTIGHNRKDSGMINGSSRGWEGNPDGSFLDQLAWVNDAEVFIGDSVSAAEDKGPVILGSVYGGGENGHNFRDAVVRMYKGTVGNSHESANDYDCGNIYGAGCGTDTYTIGEDPNEHYNPLAGVVQRNATVIIKGGHVLRNVYGAGAMGSVGTDATSGKTFVTISGGRIGTEDNNYGHVFGAARGKFGISTAASGLANVKETEVNIHYATTPAADDDEKTEQLIAGSVFGGGEAGTVKGSVAVNMTGGLVLKDVYGGGALADTQTSNWDDTNKAWAEGKTSASATTTVRLTGGNILGEAYGGGLGETGKPAYVYGDVLLDLNGTTTSGETGTVIAESARGCAVNEVFGCNNAAGTPMGDVLVHVYATQNKDKTQIANTEGDTPVTDAKVLGTYDVKAVYGGGNLAAYEPAGGKNTTYSTKVIIDGCGLTSIKQVYGGGNAASTPATNVTVNGTYEIEELFGGGNGKDDLPDGRPNPGANVGFYTYDDEAANAQTPEDRAANYGYGSGNASISVFGGTIHRVFGGSNTKGNVRKTAVTLLDEKGECEFCVDEAYGGGKSAPMDAEAKLLMACIPGLQAAYGGAEAADIQGNVELNITNGTFDRIFGGNNLSGTIHGSITVNIEEIGCRPIKIGELYCGGNQAGYSVYGYDSDGKPIESGTTPLCDDPQVNVMSFTSIGKIFGGGYGDGATMVGNPTVNVNVINGKYYNQDVSIVGENAETPNHYPIPSHDKGKMGSINNVFGGGNAAKVIGNTTVNIGTLEEVYIVKEVATGYSVSGYYTRDSQGEYHEASGTAQDGTTYYEKKAVLGADIRGNVYGGGNAAEVTGDAKVQIGKKVVPAPSPEP